MTVILADPRTSSTVVPTGSAGSDDPAYKPRPGELGGCAPSSHLPSSLRFLRLLCAAVLWMVVSCVVKAADAPAPPGAVAVPERFANTDCVDCHSDPKLSRKIQGKDVLLTLVLTNSLEKSVHASLACVD